MGPWRAWDQTRAVARMCRRTQVCTRPPSISPHSPFSQSPSPIDSLRQRALAALALLLSRFPPLLSLFCNVVNDFFVQHTVPLAVSLLLSRFPPFSCFVACGVPPSLFHDPGLRDSETEDVLQLPPGLRLPDLPQSRRVA